MVMVSAAHAVDVAAIIIDIRIDFIGVFFKKIYVPIYRSLIAPQKNSKVFDNDLNTIYNQHMTGDPPP